MTLMTNKELAQLHVVLQVQQEHFGETF